MLNSKVITEEYFATGSLDLSVIAMTTITLTILARFRAIAHQALASESKAVQPSRTIFFGGLTLIGLTAAQFTGIPGLLGWHSG
jgi:hypothetical protein